MKRIMLGLIFIYRRATGFAKRHGILKDTCVFYPTCSAYAIEAIEKHGAVYGAAKAIRRICRCHPWQKEHFDPV